MTGEKPKVSWTTILPENATIVVLPHPEIQGPYTSDGRECPWPWEPQQLVGAPIGQYHCGFCGEMVVAGLPHIDYGPIIDGANDHDISYNAYVRREMTAEGHSEEDILKMCGPVTDRERQVVAAEEAWKKQHESQLAHEHEMRLRDEHPEEF